MFTLDHPGYLLVRPFLRLEAAQSRAQSRIEIDPPEDVILRSKLRAIRWPCPRCGTLMHPVRVRAVWGTWYFNVTCPDEHNPGCLRSGEAAAAVLAIKADLIGAAPVGMQPGLFDGGEA